MHINNITTRSVTQNFPLKRESFYFQNQKKIHKIALAIFTLLSFTTVYFIASVKLTLAIFIAIPLVTSLGYIFWKVHRNSPSVDSKISVFKEMIEQNGWDHFFANKIISPNEFPNFFQKTTKDMSFNELFLFYEGAKISSKKYPSYKDKIPLIHKLNDLFNEETKQMPACNIFLNYDINKLQTYGVISPSLWEAYKIYRDKINQYNSTLNQINEDFKKDCFKAAKDFESQLEKILKNPSSNKQLLIPLKENLQILQKQHPRTWINSSLMILRFNISKSRLTSMNEFDQAQDTFKTTLSKLDQERINKEMKESKEFDLACLKINKSLT